MIIKFGMDETIKYTQQSFIEQVETYVATHLCGKSLQDIFYLSKSKEEEMPTPDNTGVVVVRTVLTDLENKLSENHKYVMFQNYGGFGDYATIDIIKLPLEMHREIVKTYMQELLKIPSSHLEREPMPFLIAGGHVETNNEKITFTGSSGDFHHHLGKYSVNDIAAYLLKEQGTPNVTITNNRGEEYINKVLDIMIAYKKTHEFYSKLVDLYVAEPIMQNESILPHQLSGLVLMKANDRISYEYADPFGALVEEITDGLGREIMLKSVAARIKRNSEKNKE